MLKKSFRYQKAFVWGCISIISFFLLICIPKNVLSQDTLNFVDAAKLKQGHWVIYNLNKKLPGYKPNQIIEEGYFLNGKKTGLWKHFYENGAIKSEITYKNNIPFGYAKFYFKNGNISEEGNWENYKWNGNYKYYYESGQLRYDWKFVNGVRESTQKYYFENGKLNFEGEWKNGGESGTIKEYNEDGTLKEERAYRNGQYDEDATKIYSAAEPPPPALIAEEKSTKKSAKSISIFNGSGNNKLYTSSGKISKEGYFLKGVLMNGKSYEYSSEGLLVKTKIYKNGKVFQVIEEK
jgi:antitoxin component YwqK of YwqJK toxin-antitoxin module